MVEVRRSSRRLATKKDATTTEPPPDPPAKKKVAPAKKKVAPAKKKVAAKTKATKPAKAKAAAAAAAKKKAAPTTTLPAADKDPEAKSHVTVIIEACKSCGVFRTRSAKILKAVGKKAKVEINKERPGKGNFIVTVSGSGSGSSSSTEGRQIDIVSLEGMKRPFPAIRALDMDDIVSNILAAIEELENTDEVMDDAAAADEKKAPAQEESDAK